MLVILKNSENTEIITEMSFGERHLKSKNPVEDIQPSFRSAGDSNDLAFFIIRKPHISRYEFSLTSYNKKIPNLKYMSSVSY